MGYAKRDTPPPRLTARRREQQEAELKASITASTAPPRIKTEDEKRTVKDKMREQFKEVPEQVLMMAVESVGYDEDQAKDILKTMVEEENKSLPTSSHLASADSRAPERVASPHPTPETSSYMMGSPTHRAAVGKKDKSGVPKKPHAKRPKGKKDIPRVSRGTSTAEDKEYHSNCKTKPTGPDATLHRGPDDDLLLMDYVSWNGPDPDIRHGQNPILAHGPDPSLIGERLTLAKGPNLALRKGSQQGLSKGSLYGSLQAESGEGRGN